MSIETIKSNYSHSRINYIERFMLLWLTFNAWYNDNDKSDKNKCLEIGRVLSAVDNDVVFVNYKEEMLRLNDITEPKLASLVKEIDKLSSRDHVDQYGNLHTSHIDTTSIKYKIIVRNGNTHTTFLTLLGELLPNVTEKEKETHKLLNKIKLFSFREKDEDTYFRKIYNVYNKMMGSEKHITSEYDAIKHIQELLSQYNIVQLGELLYSTDVDSRSFPSQEDIESGFILKSMQNDFYENSLKELLKLELSLLYKLRCLIFHGDIDMNVVVNPDINEIAKTAYEALDNILYPLMSTNSISVAE